MPDKPKVFISHSWEDNEISRQIAEYLKRDGADIWIDYARIKGGQSLPQRISEALEWCDTLILCWSQAAKDSYYVNLEWENALDLRKNIIPCLLAGIERPAILRRCLYIDFRNTEIGYQELARALNFPIKKDILKIKSIPEIVNPIKSNEKRILKEPKKLSIPKSLVFRSAPKGLSEKDVMIMLKNYDFYCKEYDWNKKYCNPNGRGIKHQYQLEMIKGDKIVIDSSSVLMWHQGGSSHDMTFKNANKWIMNLNKRGYAGYHDWRLPTLEEAMNLIEPEKRDGELYSNEIFDKIQTWIWTNDVVVGGLLYWILFAIDITRLWIVGFQGGVCIKTYHYSSFYVRAVRSG